MFLTPSARTPSIDWVPRFSDVDFGCTRSAGEGGFYTTFELVGNFTNGVAELSSELHVLPQKGYMLFPRRGHGFQWCSAHLTDSEANSKSLLSRPTIRIAVQAGLTSCHHMCSVTERPIMFRFFKYRIRKI